MRGRKTVRIVERNIVNVFEIDKTSAKIMRRERKGIRNWKGR